MSRAFVKEDEREAPAVPPSRAILPEGAVNYVTSRGLQLLQTEREELLAEQERLADDHDAERTRLNHEALGELAFRIASAQVIDLRSQPKDQVRFGATVRLRTIVGPRAGEERQFTLVGVDEADARQMISYYSPLARALWGKKVGETAAVDAEDGEEILEVVSIEYGNSETVIAGN